MTSIDLEKQIVHSSLLGHDYSTPYDSLIVAAGAGQSYFGNDHFAEWAPGMKSIDDALNCAGAFSAHSNRPNVPVTRSGAAS